MLLICSVIKITLETLHVHSDNNIIIAKVLWNFCEQNTSFVYPLPIFFYLLLPLFGPWPTKTTESRSFMQLDHLQFLTHAKTFPLSIFRRCRRHCTTFGSHLKVQIGWRITQTKIDRLTVTPIDTTAQKT